MRLQHQLGGLEGLDNRPINYEKRVFVQEWEERIFGIHTAMMALSDSLRNAAVRYDMDAVPSRFRTVWTWADLRTGAESMNPFDYFRLRYYEKWLGGITGYFLEHGYITQAELDAAMQRIRENGPATPPAAEDDDAIDRQVIRYLREGDSPLRGGPAPAFAVGDEIRVKDPPRAEHTRLPGHLRGHTGRIERVYEGSYGYFCSTGADGLGDPVPVYVVRFEPDEIWGARAEENAGPFYADLFETYLSPAEAAR
jgi:nitrile hydratase subunit beta